jgi:hypothetical protein
MFIEVESFLKDHRCLADSITTADDLFGIARSSVMSSDE